MISFQERMYKQGLILADYEKGKPICDEIDRIASELIDKYKFLSCDMITRRMRHLTKLHREALRYFKRNPLGHPHPNSTAYPQGEE